MSINQGARIHDTMHTGMVIFGAVMANGLAQAREDREARRANLVACAAAEDAGYGRKMASAADALRSKLEDAIDDCGVLRGALAERDEEIAQLKADLHAACSHIKRSRLLLAA